ncbi:hypothetical protein BpHYR1_016371, partial [Brachionus plicatilis]
MCQLIKIAFGLSLSILVLISVAPGSFGYKLDHSHKQPVQENKLEEPLQRPFNEKQINEINYCIMGCVKCANGDIYFKDESVSDTPITVTCANTCLVSPDLRDLIYDLSRRKLTKPYAK